MPDRTQADIDAEIAGIDTALADKLAGDGSSGSETEAEAKAGARGWVPKDKYKGDPAKWKDAATFLQAGERFSGNLQREVNDLRAKLADFEGTKAQFIKFHEETVARKNDELKEAISALRVQRSQAIGDGEHQLAVEIEDRIDLLKGQQQEVKALPVARPAVDENNNIDPNNPVLNEWIDDGNDWFRDDAKLRAFAVQLGSDMRKSGETAQGRKFLDKVTAQMAEEFPRKFAKSQTTRQNGVESGNAASSSSSGHSVRDLPAEDLALMKDFIKKGWTTQEKFLANYFTEGKRVHRS